MNTEITICLTNDELWNIYICLKNLTCGRHKDFYVPSLREEMVQLSKKLHELGKKEFGWA